jgi:hypothetical protein
VVTVLLKYLCLKIRDLGGLIGLFRHTVISVSLYEGRGQKYGDYRAFNGKFGDLPL